MPESLSVPFGSLLDELAGDPWSVGHSFGTGTAARLVAFGLAGRGMALFTIRDDLRTVLLIQITY